MKIYNTKRGILTTSDETSWHTLDLLRWDDLVCNTDLHARVRLKRSWRQSVRRRSGPRA